MFSLGCVLFFCVSGGRHPFGERFERDINIVNNKVDFFLVESIPEAVDLFTRLLNPDPELRQVCVVSILTCRFPVVVMFFVFFLIICPLNDHISRVEEGP